MTKRVQTQAHDLGDGTTLLVVVEGHLVEKRVADELTAVELTPLQRIREWIYPSPERPAPTHMELVAAWRWTVYRKAGGLVIAGIKIDSAVTECVKIGEEDTEAEALSAAFLFADGYVEKWHATFDGDTRTEYPYIRPSSTS